MSKPLALGLVVETKKHFETSAATSNHWYETVFTGMTPSHTSTISAIVVSVVDSTRNAEDKHP